MKEKQSKSIKIIAIETSCDETAISIVEAHEDSFTVLSHVVHSQIDVHKEYGGVFPTLAKREHGLNLVPVLIEALKKADLFVEAQDLDIAPEIIDSLERNPELQESFKDNLPNMHAPEIDYIAVTEGPGLEPALWAGISFAQALGALWNLPVIPVNHMEGHIASVLLSNTDAQVKGQKSKVKSSIAFPALALLVSGGHTELVLADSWGKYRILGKTLDDAVGEAFDKVARLMDLPYPGGPEISQRAHEHRQKVQESERFSLPRPMLHSKDLNFSFSGLKTAVRYALEKVDIDDNVRLEMSREFEDAVVETLVSKVMSALKANPVQTVILAGGVSANTHLKETLQKTIEQHYPDSTYIVPEQHLSTDNATMIALAAYTRIQAGDIPERDIVARGNLRIDA